MTSQLFGRARRSLIVASAVIGLSLPSLAQANEEAASGERAKTAEEDILVEGEAPKKVCKMETRTGSNLTRRVCRTVNDKETEGMDRLQEMRQAREAQQRVQQTGGPL